VVRHDQALASHGDPACAGHKGLIVPSRDQDVSGHVITDITFAFREMDVSLDAPSWIPTRGELAD
jgi:hypothetical protein